MKHRVGPKRHLVWLAILILLLLTGASVAIAQSELGGKIRSGDQITVPADETVDGDLYASGGQVRIEGTVDGDLVVAAGTVTVLGEVTGDVMASAGTVDISGDVIGDARIAVGTLTVSGSIGEDLFVAAGQATVAPSGEVGEDLVFGSGRMTMDGTVNGDVLGGTGMYERNGTVAGEERVTVDREEEEEPTLLDRSLNALQRFIGLLLVAALFLWLAPRVVTEPAQTLRRRPLAALGIGIVALVGFAVAVFVLILIAVLVAIGLALVGLADLVGAVVFAAIVAVVVLAFVVFMATVFGGPVWVGMSVTGMPLDSNSAAPRWGALVIGLVLVVVLTSIPIVGGWIGFLVVILGLGALTLAYWRRRPAPQKMEQV